LSLIVTLEDTRQRYLYVLLPAYIAIVIVYILQNVPLIASTPSPLDLHAYLNYISTGVQIITGLITAVALYYIGKIHDSRKEYISYLGDLEEHSSKVRRWLHNSTIDTSRSINTIDELYSYFEQVQQRLPHVTRNMIGLTLLTIAMMIWGLIAMSFHRTDLGSTISIIVVTLTGIYLFIVFWLMYEKILSIYNDQLRILSNLVGTLKSFD
jgi:hypothetical protein